jgi:hypothetical protein
MADPFVAVAEAFAGLLRTTSEVAGFILGFLVIGVFLIAFTLIFGEDALKGRAMLVVFAFPMTFVVLVAWWPPWTILFIVIMVLAAWAFGRGGGE